MLRAHLDTLAGWGPRRWWSALAAAVGTILFIGVPTVLIPNPVFGREIETTWWSWPTLIVAALLTGLVMATYVRQPGLATTDDAPDGSGEKGSRRGLGGGLLTFFAVGCPVCNKLVLLLLGYAGAMQWFAPVQPFLAVAAVAALVWGLHARLKGERECADAPDGGPPDAAARPARPDQRSTISLIAASVRGIDACAEVVRCSTWAGASAP